MDFILINISILKQSNSTKQSKMSSTKKFTKTDKAELITAFFANQGKRMTNLSKVKVDKLDEIIKKYEIDIENEYCKRAESKLIREKEQRERDREFETERMAKDFDAKRKWDKLTDDIKEKCYNALWEKKNESQKADEDRQKRTTDIFGEKAKQDGARVERIDDNTLKVNGVNVIFSSCSFDAVTTKEQDLITMKKSHQQKFTYTDKRIVPMIEAFILKLNTFKFLKTYKKKIVKKVVKIKLIILDDDDFEIIN